ncbi:MAG TPA: hypothetical protein VEK57_22940 [Thermoanaerobaculia bacterium]|nr:hypothetical protein [Thermoanaerobaculia bacterium]
MKITMERISTNDSMPGMLDNDDAPYEVLVRVEEEKTTWCRSAAVIVFVARTATSLDEIRSLAVEQTREFLSKALEAVNAEQR